MKIIGAEIKSGEYQGRNYCNVMVFGTYPITSGKGVGDSVESVKVKYDMFCQIRGISQVDESDLKALVGKNIEFGYTKYGQVNNIIEHPEAPKGKV